MDTTSKRAWQGKFAAVIGGLSVLSKGTGLAMNM